MKTRFPLLALLLALLLPLLLSACSRVTPENFAKVQDGMSEQEVAAVLGSPAESDSVNVLGVSGTTSRWVSGDTVITVRFVNGKVALKTLEKSPGRK
jgi:SmpA/OmlA family protein